MAELILYSLLLSPVVFMVVLVAQSFANKDEYLAKMAMEKIEVENRKNQSRIVFLKSDLLLQTRKSWKTI